MIPAIGAISSYNDIEYQRILAEMRKLGLTPSGNKFIDKIKLNQAKKEKEEEKFELEETNMLVNSAREDMEEKRLGATQLSNINRFLLGL